MTIFEARATGGLGDLRRARHLVDCSVDDQPTDTRQAAVLLASECVTNAVRHGGGRVDLHVERFAGKLRVEVADSSPEPPMPERTGPEDERGRGLAIVEGLASRWGAEQRANDGKVVWFVVSLEGPSPSGVEGAGAPDRRSQV